METIDPDESPAMRIWGAKVDQMTWRRSDETDRRSIDGIWKYPIKCITEDAPDVSEYIDFDFYD